nr:uncharacterized protein LOC113813750 [Penaeus vannamei]
MNIMTRVCDPESQRHSHLLLPLYETLEVVGFPRIVGSVSPVLPRGQSDVQPLHAPRPGLLGGASGPQPPLRHLRGAAPGRAQGHSQDRPLPPGGGERGAAGVRGRLHLLRLHGLQPSVNYEHWKDSGFCHKDKGSFLRKGKVGGWRGAWPKIRTQRWEDWCTLQDEIEEKVWLSDRDTIDRASRLSADNHLCRTSLRNGELKVTEYFFDNDVPDPQYGCNDFYDSQDGLLKNDFHAEVLLVADVV